MSESITVMNLVMKAQANKEVMIMEWSNFKHERSVSEILH